MEETVRKSLATNYKSEKSDKTLENKNSDPGASLSLLMGYINGPGHMTKSKKYAKTRN